MLTTQDLAKLRVSYNRPDLASARNEVLAELGNPSAEQIAEAALAGMSDQDRNVRVMMLRILDQQKTPGAIAGILLGLNDAERRVREVAVKCSVPHLSDIRILKRLREIALDEKEKRKTREYAFGHVVSSLQNSKKKVSTDFSKLVMKESLESERYRQKVLFHLVMLDLTEKAEELLKYFIKNGTREEAVTATRALCGFKVINLGGINDRKEKKKIMQTCELAAGRVWYWVKRDR